MIIDHRYVIAVPDLAASARYYSEVLDFEVREIGDDGWRFFIRDGCIVMAGHWPDAIPPIDLGDHSYFAYIVLDSIGPYFDRVIAAGGDVIKGLRDEPWGMREFAVRTVDGHRIMFGSPLSA